jgi:hypothetical protein
MADGVAGTAEIALWASPDPLLPTELPWENAKVTADQRLMVVAKSSFIDRGRRSFLRAKDRGQMQWLGKAQRVAVILQ